MPADLPAPLPLAMVVCDAIWVDPSTKKPTLLGLFSELGAKNFPVVHPIFAVHLCLTDAIGTVPIKLQLVDADEEEEPLFVVEQEVAFPDRRAMINIGLNMRGVSFPKAGEYRLQLFARGEFVIERRLVMRHIT